MQAKSELVKTEGEQSLMRGADAVASAVDSEPPQGEPLAATSCGPSERPLQIASTLPGGLHLCTAYNLASPCEGQCGRVHRCWRILASAGKACGEEHPRVQCTRKGVRHGTGKGTAKLRIADRMACTLPGGQIGCKLFNTCPVSLPCAGPDGKCAFRRAHACTFQLPTTSRACAQAHPRSECPHRQQYLELDEGDIAASGTSSPAAWASSAWQAAWSDM